MISCIYIAASTRDSRFARICAASIRSYYPELPVFLLPGGRLERGLAEELRTHWNVQLAKIPAGDYGWGFVKLVPLFGPPGAPFLMLDADTVMTGPVLDRINSRLSVSEPPAFLVDEEEQPESEIRRLYYDWERVAEVDPGARCPAFVFNSGQWVGTPGIVGRDDFDPWVEWGMPPKLRHAEVFMPGDQGILNYVLNQGHTAERFRVDRLPLMCWPGHGMEDFSADKVRNARAPARVVHWAGMKRLRFSDMQGADLLIYFEKIYYGNLSFGVLRRHLFAFGHLILGLYHRLRTWVRLFWCKKISNSSL